MAKAVDAVNNNNATHRLAKAFRQDCVTTLIDAMTTEREEYFGIIHKCPPLPDCVFEKKIFLKPREDDSDAETIVEVIDLGSDDDKNENEDDDVVVL